MKNVNLIEMLRGCSKRNGMAVSASNPDGQPTVNRQSRLMSHRGYLRNLAMIFAVLVLSVANVGMAWGADDYIVAAKAGISASALSAGSTASIYVGKTKVFVLKTNHTTIAGTTDLTTTTINDTEAALYYNSTSLTNANLTNTSNYSSSSTSSRTMGAAKMGKGKSCEISFGSKKIASAEIIYRFLNADANNYLRVASVDKTKRTTNGIFSESITIHSDSTKLTIINAGQKDVGFFVILTEAAPSCSDDTGLAYGTGTVNKTYGDGSFTNTLTNSNSLSVSYSSSNTDVATVNSSTGAVTIKAAGTATITATWAGNATYCADAVSYTLNVKPAVGSVSGAWDRFGGETISLSVTPSGGSSYTYQWQKYNGSGWDNVSNGTVSGATTTGATSANLQIANCGGGNSGTYRCQVTAGDQTNETGGLQVKVFTLECYNGGTTVYNFTRDGENQAGSVEIDLAANTAYTFKFHVDNTYYGNNASINEDITNYVFCNSDNGGNCAKNFTINSGLGGTFTFTMDYSTGGNSSVLGEPELSVTYPRKRIYLSPGVWTADGAKFAIYYYLGVNNGWTDFMTPNDCGMSAEIPQWNGVTMIAARINGALDAPEFGDGKCWNQTGNLTVTSNDYIVVNAWDNITYNSTYSIPTYTISYNAGTGGSGSKASESKTCGVAFTLPNSAVFTRTGYTQTGWTTSDGGAQEYALGGTYTTNEDKTFYPVWTVNNYDLTWNLGGGTTTSAGTGIASGVSVNTTTSQAYGTALTAPTVTKANYTFSAWSPTVASTMPAANTTYTATWTANQYSVTHSLTGVTTSSGATGANAATYGTDYTAVFAKNSGYTLPNSVTVTAGGSDITANCTYTKGTGTVSIPGSYITGNIVITVTGVEEEDDCGITLTQFGTQYKTSSPRRLYTYTSNSFDERFIIEASSSNEHGVTYSSTDSLYMFVNNGQSFKVHASDVLKDSIFEDVTKIKFKYRAGKSGKSITLTFDVYVGGTKVGTVSKAITDQTWYTETINVSPAKDGRVIFKNTGSSSDYALHFDEINICGTLPTSCDEITPTWSTDYTSPTLNVGGTSSMPVVGKDGSSGAVTFSSSATDIATVNSSGVVTGVKTGTAIITATVAADDENNKCEGTVTKTFTIKAGVTYNKNGADSGDAPTDANTYAANADITIKGNTGSMVEAGKVFNGWNTKADGTGTHYEVGATMKMPNKSAGVTLYAEWVGYATSWEWWNSGASNDGTTFTYLTNKNYVLSFASSGSTAVASWDMSGGAYYKGVKIKTKDHSMSFWVQTGKSVSITFGTRPTKPTFTVGGVDKSSEVGASENKDSVTVTYTTSADTKFYIENETSTGTAFTIKRVLIEDVAAEYTLAWNSNGGSALAGDYTSGTVTAGDAITAPNDPTLSNYTFDGWKTNNDGTGSGKASTMPAANTTYYAAWKQTVTLTTGAQGSGSNQTPIVYLNGTRVSDFTPHTASGYALQGYYTAGSGGVKVLNADGTFAAANVTDYITSSKWSRTGAAPTLYAQWVAAEDCHTLKYAWKITGKFCDDESTVTASDTVRFPANASNLYFTESGTGNTVVKGSSYNIGKTQNNYFLLTAKSGYQFKSICFYGKIEDSSVNYTTDGSSWSSLASTGTSSDDYYSFNNINASAFGIKLTASSPNGVWIRNMVIEVCASDDVTYNVTYDDNGSTGGTAPTDNTDYSYGDAVTVLGNTGSLEKTNYTFAGWATNDDGTGSSYVEDNTFSITGNTTLYAKWTQAVTLDKNGGSTDGSATAVWNATGLTGITHAKPAAGYKLLGYYSASSEGTKVLNSDGSFAATNVTGYITSGKWSRTSATTLYAEYESAGALTWNLIVNSDTTNLSTSTKTSAFTEISTANMSNATVNGLTYNGDAKASLTGKISTPAYDAGKYVYVTFQVAAGYKFTPSSIAVKVQPVGENEHKAVELSLADATNTLASSSATKCAGTSSGKTTTVTLAGNGTYFTGTVTLKIYVYPHGDATAASNNCYRLGTPITIEGEIEEACATMPSYKSMSYTTTTFAPSADASGSPITIVGGDNIDTYQWKYNTVNDRTSGTNCGTGTSLTPLTDASATTDGTRYYWCEMTNEACGITIKSPAVAITVAAAKSDATVTWTDPASTPNYGGGGYTIKATVDQTGWNGNAADLVITAPAGIRIYNVTSGTDGNSRKYVQADFDVQTSFDRTTYASNIPFTVSAAATATYNAISNDHNTAYSACTGAGEGSSYNILMRKTVTKDGNYYHCANTDGWISPNISSSYSTAKAGTTMATYFDTVASSNTQYVWVRTYHANVNKVRIYADFRANDMTVSNVYKHTDYFTANNKYLVDYTAVYNGDEENENTGTAAQGYVDITLDEVMAANDILLVKFNDSKVRPLGAVITESSAGSLNTHLQWSSGLADGATVNKYTTDAYFTYSASMITENTNSLGAITYSSSVPSVATVDATGKVAMVAAGTTTIKATLAASGCYKKAEISYTLNVTEEECAIAAGTLTLTSGSESKCSGDEVTLTLTGFESGAALQWKDGDTEINNGGNYTIVTDGTTSTLTTNQPGTYSVMVTKDCSVRSNRITISNISATASVTKIVDEWYVKNGRLTPDIELWSLSEGATLKSVAWSPTNGTGLSCVARGGVIYLEGKSPSSNDSGNDIEYTLTATITDECNADHEETTKTIKITHQKNTDKHVLAFVVEGTAKGGFTAGITAAQTTSVPLYNEIADNFDVLATNIYSTDDEKKLKEYYSQFDILCITDYPNTKTKGVNSKSYVDAMGALVDIRPILTMEAWVSGLANWKAKGISGNPKSPTTRQYTMDLQCKDHEIFAGTKLTKVGEGDEAMYRVSMVCDTLEDYKTLDATYGAGEHAEKSGYNYGGKPALQGFTFTQEMSDNDLLPIGLINDGAGNPLQVGIERQHNMEARLMVLGINSYAMERLANDGERIVINSLKYLMKKSYEDIADCSTAFVGGAEGDTKNWGNPDNWTGNTVPLPSQKVRILAECEVSSTVHALDVLIVTDGKYNHGSDDAAGKLTIKENGALIVGGKIQAASAPAYNRPRATTPDKLLIETSDEHQAALIFDNEEAETQATVNLYSLGRKPSSYQYQYFAVPMEVVPVNPTFANETHGGTGIYTYVYEEASSGWTRRKYYDDLFAFEGLGITTKSATAMEYEMTGNLASTATKEITLTHDGAGLNLIGNSWMAPIQIGALTEDNTDANITQTVYIYCAGRDAVEGAAISGVTETAGQWIAIPFEAAEFETWKEAGKLSVIPAMQAFQIKVDAEATLTLDYNKVVRGSTNDLNAKLRAPGRRMAANEVTMTNIRVADSKTHTDLSLFEGDRFSEAFDNGWEAEYMSGDGRSAKLYAETEAGQMAVAAMYDYEGTVVGFAPGKETEYTFSFMGEDNGYYLNDIKLQNSVRISEGETYTFTYEEGDTENRFYISRTPIDAPQISTGVDNTGSGEVKARKFIYRDKMYILINGRVYSADGALVK